MLLRFRYVFNHPFAMDGGGAKIFVQSVTKELGKNYEIKHLDMEFPVVDFDVLLVFSFTFFDVEVLKWYKLQGVRIVVFPIFDRTQSLLKYKLIKPFWNTLIGKSSVHVIRREILRLADVVINANETEKSELVTIYDMDDSKATVLHQGLADSFFEVASRTTKDLFTKEYGIENFLFCPAMSINNRKNQINLLKAIENTNYKLVLNNTNRVEDGLDTEFAGMIMANHNVFCLQRMELEMMISAYKACEICISVSNAETAGYTNIEAGYCGAKIVASNIPAFVEYLGTGATFVDQKDPQDILRGIQKSSSLEFDPTIRDLATSDYQWSKFASRISELLG